MGKLLPTLIRHQAGSLIASAIDFSTMIGGVRLLGLHPALATAWGAAMGGTANFFLGRHWIFPDGRSRAGASALRYALVSLISLALNTVGEYISVSLLHLQYVLARLIVACAVSVLWNFPMQRSFVYRSVIAP
jgi:putative flippase GtrA